MKHIKVTSCLYSLLLLASCRPAANDDAEKVKTVLIDYYDGVKLKDHQKMLDATTGDFLLFHTGVVENNDSVFKRMARLNYTVEFKFDNFRVDVDENIGHLSYHEQANFVFDDTLKMNLQFLGSSAFRKVKNEWKMNFMHSSALKLKKK